MPSFSPWSGRSTPSNSSAASDVYKRQTYQLSHEAARAQRQTLESIPKAQRRIGELKRAISGLGNINLDAIEEFQRVNERYTYLTGQRDDVQKSKTELERVIADITGEMKAIFAQQFSIINQAFGETFLELFGGGKATLELEDETDILNCGIEIRVQPPGKALKVLSLLSGGEKAFVAIALYFAILKVRPPPSASWTRSRPRWTTPTSLGSPAICAKWPTGPSSS